MRGMHSALVAAAAMSLAMGNASGPAIRPEPEHKRYLVKVPSRADKKRAHRRQEHARNVAAKLNRVRNSNKLGRRLRRKFELGMAGAF